MKMTFENAFFFFSFSFLSLLFFAINQMFFFFQQSLNSLNLKRISFLFDFDSFPFIKSVTLEIRMSLTQHSSHFVAYVLKLVDEQKYGRKGFW